MSEYEPIQSEVLKAMQVKEYKSDIDSSEYIHVFGLSKSGQPINLIELTADIAEKPSTQVILFGDWQGDTAGKP